MLSLWLFVVVVAIPVILVVGLVWIAIRRRSVIGLTVLAALIVGMLAVLGFQKMSRPQRSWNWMLEQIDSGRVARITRGMDRADVTLSRAGGGLTYRVEYPGGRLTEDDAMELEKHIDGHDERAHAATAAGQAMPTIEVVGSSPPSVASSLLPIVVIVGLGSGAIIAVVVLIVVLSRRRPVAAIAPAPEASAARGPQLAAALAPASRASGQRSPAPPIDELQAAFPELEILELIGQGGMGAVYRVRRLADGRILALKAVAGDGEHGEAFASRFLREAEALERLDHPNIVAIRAHGRSGRWCWLLMDHIDGANLRQVMATGALSPAQALALVPPLCQALQYAHDQGVVHRDIKPENILIDQRGVPHVVDFGLAKLSQEISGEALTGSGVALGTLHYMAPEQVERARVVDHRADIYALGVVIYEVLTGRLPLGRFEAPSHSAAVDARIDEVVLRALERDPERRWQRASQVGDALERLERAPRSVGADAVAAGDARIWGMDERGFLPLLHLSQFASYIVPLAGLILPLAMWLSGRDRSRQVDAHGRAVLNWTISALIYAFVSAALCFVIIGIPLFIALALFCIVFPIIGAVRAGEGRLWRYPLSIPFLPVSDDPEVAPPRPGAGGVLLGCGLALVLAGLVVGGLLLFSARQSPRVTTMEIQPPPEFQQAMEQAKQRAREQGAREQQPVERP